MTIDEAIKHCEEKVEQLEGYAEPYRSMGNCEKCAEEHRQLAEWLKDYKQMLEQEPCEDCISRREAISIASIATLSVNQVVTALEKLPPVNPQKPKSEWQQDHEILKAYSDGVNDVIDEIKADIEYDIREAPYMYDDEHLDELHGYQDGLEHALNIIDKYKAEGSEA